MKNNAWRLLLAQLLTALFLARAANAQISMRIIGPGTTTSPIAIPGLKNLGGDSQQRLSAAFVDTLRRDLTLSGLFRVIDPHAYVEDSQATGYDLGQFNFADWSSINATFLVKGGVEQRDGKVTLTAMLFDVGQQRRMMGKRFSGERRDMREMARRFADAVMQAVTGQRGPFDTKLAYVSTRGGRFKEIYVSPLDGHSLFRVTNNPTINLFPSFDRSARHLLYLSYKSGHPDLYLADLQARREVRISNSLGEIIGGTLAPDGRTIAAAITRGGATNLYLLDTAGAQTRALTNNRAINVGPSFSTDGGEIAFTSDRSGTPQIYLMGLHGGAARRITYRGNYNTNAALSPDGKWIAYQARQGSHFSIERIAASGGEPVRLDDGIGSNTNPAWSPDGRYLVFSSTRGGRNHLYLMMVGAKSGKITSRLTEDDGNETNPVWSWWLGG